MISDIIREIKASFEQLPEWEKEYIRKQVNREVSEK